MILNRIITSGSGSRLFVPPIWVFSMTNLYIFYLQNNIVAVNFFFCLHEGSSSFRRSLQPVRENVQIKKFSIYSITGHLGILGSGSASPSDFGSKTLPTMSRFPETFDKSALLGLTYEVCSNGPFSRSSD